MRAWLPAACLLVACSAPLPPMLPIVATPPPTLPAPADVLRACAFEVSCFHAPIASSITECAAYLTAGLNDWIAPRTFLILPTEPAELRRWVDCADAGSDCAGVLDCVSRHHDVDYCTAHPGFTCDGDLLVQCNPPSATPDPALFTTDCAALGMRCIDQGGGAAACSDGTTCDPKSNSRCDGNRYYESCGSATKLRYRLDCALSSIPNATCRSSSSRTGCLPSGPPCAGDRCEGNVRVTCLVGEEVRDDCTQVASTCAIVNGAPTCVPVASDCGATNAACAGSAIKVCHLGTLDTIDCSALGLSACMKNAGGDGPLCY